MNSQDCYKSLFPNLFVEGKADSFVFLSINHFYEVDFFSSTHLRTVNSKRKRDKKSLEFYAISLSKLIEEKTIDYKLAFCTSTN